MKLLITLTTTLLAISVFGQWNVQESGLSTTGLVTRNFSAVNNNVIWRSMGGTDLYYTKTTDGGVTWQEDQINEALLAPEAYEISQLFAVDENRAYALLFSTIPGGGGTLYQTSNGGATWTENTQMFNGATSFPNVIHFFDANEGVAIGDPENGYVEIYRTLNGGANWTRVTSGNIPPVLGADEYGTTSKYNFDGNTIWYPTIRGRIFYSTDRGATWNVTQVSDVVLNDPNAFINIGFRDQNSGVAITYDGANFVVKETNDGGASWTPYLWNGPLRANLVQSNEDRTLFAFDGGGTSYSLDGTTWIEIDATADIDAMVAQNGLNVWASYPNTSSLDGIYKLDEDVTKQITAISLDATDVCPRERVNLSYTLNFDFNTGNVFTVETSIDNATWTQAIDVTSTTNGTINFGVPGTADAGPVYVRLVSSNPTRISETVQLNVTQGLPNNHAYVFGNPVICYPNEGFLEIAELPNTETYDWQVSAGFSITENNNTNVLVAASSAGNTGEIYVLASNSCGSINRNIGSIDIIESSQNLTTGCAVNFGDNYQPFSAEAIYITDNNGEYTGCVAYPPNSFDGKIAVIDRGACFFSSKAYNAQNAGAIGVIMINNIPGDGPINLFPGPYEQELTIPVISLSFEDGDVLKNQIALGTTTVQLNTYKFDISAQDVPVINSITTTESECENPTGTASVNATVVTAGYTEDWQGEDPNALLPGNYNVTIVDDNGCSASESYTIDPIGGICPDITSVSLSTTDVCPRERIDLTYTVATDFYSGNIFTVETSTDNATWTQAIDVTSTTNGTINFGVSGAADAGPVYVRLVSSNPTRISETVQLNVTQGLPNNHAYVFGNPVICYPNEGFLEIAPLPNTETYDWQVSPGFSITENNNTNVLVAASAAGNTGEIYVLASNSCGSINRNIGSIDIIESSQNLTTGCAINYGDNYQPFSAEAIYITDNNGEYTGCVAYPPNSFDGKFAVIDRGACFFSLKAYNAQNAGAIGVIMINNIPGDGPINLGAGPYEQELTIPVISLSFEDGDILKNQIALGITTVQLNTYKFDISSQNAPVISAINVSNPSDCLINDGSLVIDGTGNGTLLISGTVNQSLSVTLPYNVTNLDAGNYSFTFNDGTCDSDEISVTLVDPNAPPTPTINVAGDLEFCEGGSVTLTSSAANNNTWSTMDTDQSIVVTQSGDYSVTVTEAGCTSTSEIITVNVLTNPVAPAISVSGPIAFCEGGNVELTASYASDIEWSNQEATQTIVVSESGTYTVEYSDGQCSSVSAPVIVEVYENPTISEVQTTESSCSTPTGTATVIATGGTPGYIEDWFGENPNALSFGTYTVRITDVNNCIAESSFQITNVNAPEITVVASDLICFGDNNSGSVEIVGSAGTPAYEYSIDGVNWQTETTVSNLSEGAYTAYVRDGAGCTNTEAFEINEPAEITFSQTLEICSGESVTVGSNTYTSSNTYVDVLQSVINGCDSTVTTILTVNPLPSATVEFVDGVLSVSEDNAQYQWYDCGTSQTIPNATNQEYVPSANGSYSVTVTNNDGCLNESDCFEVTGLSLEEISIQNILKVYPIPFTDELTIETNEEGQLEIMDLAGKTIKTIVIANEKTILNLDNLARGSYVISLRTKTGNYKKRIIKQ